MLIYTEWEKWNVKPSQTPGDQTAELEESTTIIGDAGVRGNYLKEDEGTFITVDAKILHACA